jgi:hypothetical protein
MTPELGLLLLESTLIVATVALLVYNIHEGKQGETLIKEGLSQDKCIFYRR